MRDSNDEELVPINGYENYFITKSGNIYSSNAKSGMRLIKPAQSTSQRLAVCLSQNGARKTHYVGRLVLEAFNGPRPDNCIVQYLDGNFQNCALDNLRYVRRPRALTDKQVIKIRQLRRENISARTISERFNVDRSTIGRILTKKAYADVADEQSEGDE